MNNTKKTIVLLGLCQYSVEILEELIEDKHLAHVFTFNLKKSSKDLIKYSDKLINAVCENATEDVKEDVYNVYKVMSEMVEAIEWEEKQLNSKYERQDSGISES